MRSGILFYAYLPNLLIISILCILPLYALCRTIFGPYFGSHKIHNSLILKNMQKKISGSHPTLRSRSLRPLNPFVSYWYSGSYIIVTSVLLVWRYLKTVFLPCNIFVTFWNIFLQRFHFETFCYLCFICSCGGSSFLDLVRIPGAVRRPVKYYLSRSRQNLEPAMIKKSAIFFCKKFVICKIITIFAYRNLINI